MSIIKNGRVVVVDDEPSMTSFCRRVLEEAGCTVWVAHNGRDGIETILTADPDVVLLDVKMPVVQGYEVCRYIKNRGVKAKILMLSAMSTEKDKRYALEAGADAYLPKPFQADDLLDRVNFLLER